MDSMVMNTDGCDIAHETLVLEKYGTEVMCAGWNPQLNLPGDSLVHRSTSTAICLRTWRTWMSIPSGKGCTSICADHKRF